MGTCAHHGNYVIILVHMLNGHGGPWSTFEHSCMKHSAPNRNMIVTVAVEWNEVAKAPVFGALLDYHAGAEMNAFILLFKR